MKIATRFAAASAACIVSTVAHAQVAHGGQPLGLERLFATRAPVLVVPTPDVSAYRAEDEARGHRPLRYGALVDVAADVSSGEWTELADGSRAWRLEIVSPGARSLAIEFARFELPRGARFYVYDRDVETWLGAYTRANRQSNGGFVFEPFPGERMTLEIDVPAGAPDPAIAMRALIHDYRGVRALMSGTVLTGTVPIGGGGPVPGDECLIDVNCPPGDAWSAQKRATVRTLSHGQTCSGALINNTANDGTAYVLTAEHCAATTDCIFFFNFQTPGCGTGIAPANQTVAGCTVLATNVTCDNRLLRIDSAIPAAFAPYYAGWNRTRALSTFAFTMGHPSGGPKKIAIDPDGAVLETLFGAVHWRVAWSAGYVQAGSSGGALFDETGRIRGVGSLAQFTSGTCDQSVWFGRFDLFWASNPIAQWLDPLGTAAVAIDGFDPFPCAPPQNVCMTSPNSVGPGATMSWSGSQSRATNDFNLLTSGCPPGTSGIYYYGPTRTIAPFGNGFRCVASPVVRLTTISANLSGNASFDLDLTGSQIDAGETWYFQFWYRNTAGGGAFFNLSDALAVPFCN